MLEIKHVHKKYKDITALQDISLTLEVGIYALLGPNGSGKSTFMRILCNQCKKDQGEVLYDGKDISKNASSYYRDLGYAPQQQGLYDEFSGERFLTYMALLKDIPKDQIQAEVKRVAKSVNMEEHLKKRCKTYSGGMKQRLLVANALLGNPKILLFDEPTAGLDPKERVSLRNVFERLGKDHILLIATHVVSDVESIADYILFLKKGRMIEEASPEVLYKKYQEYQLEEIYLSLFQEEVL